MNEAGHHSRSVWNWISPRPGLRSRDRLSFDRQCGSMVIALDWPEDAKRSLIEAIECLLKKPETKKKLGTLDSFGSWVGLESAEEILDMIYSARTTRAMEHHISLKS